MSIPPARPQVLAFFGTPLVLEPSAGQRTSAAGLLPVRRSLVRLRNREEGSGFPSLLLAGPARYQVRLGAGEWALPLYEDLDPTLPQKKLNRQVEEWREVYGFRAAGAPKSWAGPSTSSRKWG